MMGWLQRFIEKGQLGEAIEPDPLRWLVDSMGHELAPYQRHILEAFVRGEDVTFQRSSRRGWGAIREATARRIDQWVAEGTERQIREHVDGWLGCRTVEPPAECAPTIIWNEIDKMDSALYAVARFYAPIVTNPNKIFVIGNPS